jgi:hypothetical protein
MNIKRSISMSLLVSSLSLTAAALPAFADHGKKPAKADKAEKKEAKAAKHDEKAGPHAARPAQPTVIVVDRDGHRRVVHEFVTSGLPPGLAKRESLPPGLRKQLRERGQLPPGLQKRLTPVPPALVTRLPALPPYYSRYFVGRDLVIIDTRTNQVVAVIQDAWS